MTDAQIRIIIRVCKRRYEAGEDIDTILDNYPKLTPEEREKIKMAVTGNGKNYS